MPRSTNEGNYNELIAPNMAGYSIIMDELNRASKKEEKCSDSDTKEPKKLLCVDCGEEIDKESVSIFNHDMYCKECISEHKAQCSLCGVAEQHFSEFCNYTIENKDGIREKIVCMKCTKKLVRCQSTSSCNILIERGAHVCTCGDEICSIHADVHKCGKNIGIHSKDFSPNRKVGSIKRAEKIKSKRYVGVELEAVNGKPRKINGLLDGIGITYDGSLEGAFPIELQTPPASASALEAFVENATKALRNASFKVNKSCGVHVNIDATEFRNNPVKLLRIIQVYYAIEPLMLKMLPRSRRNNRYSLPLRAWIDNTKMFKLSQANNPTIDMIHEAWYKTVSHDDISSFMSHKYDTSRYHGVNMHSVFRNGRLEIRHHHGSLNKNKIINWIKFNLMLVDWALANWNQDVIDAISMTDSIHGKLRIMNRRMGIGGETRRYILRCIKKFEHVEVDSD